MTEIRVPTLGESVTEATIGRWTKKAGDAVAVDEPLVELETDKVTIEVPAPLRWRRSARSLPRTARPWPSAHCSARSPMVPAAPSRLQLREARCPGSGRCTCRCCACSRSEVRTRRCAAGAVGPQDLGRERHRCRHRPRLGQGWPRDQGRHARCDRKRLRRHRTPINQSAAAVQVRAPSPADDAAREERVKMTRLRQTIARRLKDVQNTAAMLTTFNEVDMTNVMALRSQYKDVFEKKHGTKLGFMGFFTKACVQALKDVPAVNAEIDGSDLIYKNYYHVGVAVGTDKGLVVPVVRDCDTGSISDIEKTIADFGKRARDGQLKIDEMQGGTFTITNGGIYGSLMSTPILNAPQSAILGMHKIQERPVVVGGKIEIRPMMYLAVSYDHRVIDGKEAVTFLVRVKESLEDPARLVLDL